MNRKAFTQVLDQSCEKTKPSSVLPVPLSVNSIASSLRTLRGEEGCCRLTAAHSNVLWMSFNFFI